MVKYPAKSPTKLSRISWAKQVLKASLDYLGQISSPLLSRFTLNISKQTLRDFEDWSVNIYAYYHNFVFVFSVKLICSKNWIFCEQKY